MMVYHRNTVYIWKNREKKDTKIDLIPGVSGAGLEGFQGSRRGNRVGRVEVASLARGGSGSDRRAGSSPYVAAIYEKIGPESGG